MFLRGCFQILIILGTFYGALYGIYLLLDGSEEGINPEEHSILINPDVYYRLVEYRSEGLTDFLRKKSANYPTSSQGNKEVSGSLNNLTSDEILAFLAQSYVSRSIPADAQSSDQLKGLTFSHAASMVHKISSSDKEKVYSYLCAHLLRDGRMQSPGEEPNFWNELVTLQTDKYFKREHIAIAIQNAGAANTYKYLKESGITGDDETFRADHLSIELAKAGLDNLLTHDSEFQSSFENLYTSLISLLESKGNKSEAIDYLFQKIDGSQPQWVEDFFIEVIKNLSDDDITNYLKRTDYVEGHFGGIYKTFHPEFFQSLPEESRSAMVDILDQGFVGFFEAQVIEDLSRSDDVSTEENSLSYYSDQINLYPEDPFNYVERGKILANEYEDFPRAISDFSRAIDLDETFSDAYFERSLAREKLNDIAGSIADYDKVVELEPDYTYAFGNRAIMKHQIGDYLGAIDDYTTTISLDPTYIDAFYGRGLSKSMSGDTIGALEDYSKAIEINEDYHDAYINRALIKLEMGNISEALIDYETVVEIRPDHLDGLYGMAYTYYRMDSLEKASHYYESLVERYPQETDAYYSLGIIYNQQEDYQKAYSFFTKSIFMDSTYTDALVQRGLSSLYQNDTLNACLDWVKATEKDSQEASQYLISYCKR